MIEPFSETVKEGVLSYGITCAGYDLRLASDVLVCKNTYGEILDPKKCKDADYMNRLFEKRHEGSSLVLPPGSALLGHSYEYICMPKNVKARCYGKSTLARVFILVNVTPLEPGWEGHLTIEISNVCNHPVRLYLMEGIAQLEFERIEEPASAYTGVYQRQTGVTASRVMEDKDAISAAEKST